MSSSGKDTKRSVHMSDAGFILTYDCTFYSTATVLSSIVMWMGGMLSSAVRGWWRRCAELQRTCCPYSRPARTYALQFTRRIERPRSRYFHYRQSRRIGRSALASTGSHIIFPLSVTSLRVPWAHSSGRCMMKLCALSMTISRRRKVRTERVTGGASDSRDYCLLPEWIKVPMLPTMMEIVCRTSNRLFVGLPLCESHDLL